MKGNDAFGITSTLFLVCIIASVAYTQLSEKNGIICIGIDGNVDSPMGSIREERDINTFSGLSSSEAVSVAASYDGRPSIFGDTIVFMGVEAIGEGYHLMCYNISSATLMEIQEYGLFPSIYNNTLAFLKYADGIGLYDICTSTSTSITVLNPFDATDAFLWARYWPADPVSVYGNIVAFYDSEGIWFFDISQTPIVFNNIGNDGRGVCVYGNIIAFSEGGIIKYFNLTSGIKTNTGVPGVGPSVYCNSIFTFHDPPTIKYYNINSETISDTLAIGDWPSIYGKYIAFSTNETIAGTDLNNDGDTDDCVIRYYDMSTGTTVNTEEVGECVKVHGNTVSFGTEEVMIGKDLNDDGDMNDIVIRFLRPLRDESVTFPVGSYVIPMDAKQNLLTTQNVTVYGFIWAILDAGADMHRIIEPPNVTLKTTTYPGGAVYSGGVILVTQPYGDIIEKTRLNFSTITIDTLVEPLRVSLNQLFFVEKPTKILVIQGIWGHTETTLNWMALPYTLASKTEVENNATMIFDYDLVVVDCPGWSGIMPQYIVSNFTAFASQGGNIIFTDIALKDLAQVFPNYVNVVGNMNWTGNVTVHNPPLTGFLAEFPSQYPSSFPQTTKIYTMGGGRIVDNVLKPCDVRVLVDSSDYGGDYRILAFYIPYYEGVVEGFAYHPQEQVETITGNPFSYVVSSIFYGNKFIHTPTEVTPPMINQKFGPRANKVLIKLYSSDETELNALEQGQIDITDWPLSKSYYDLFKSSFINPVTGHPYKKTINVVSYDDFDLSILDINNNNNPYLAPGYPNPRYPNPTSVKEMRQAIAFLTNRALLPPLTTPLYTPVPPFMGAYSHPQIKPGGTLAALTYPFSPADAIAKLNVGHFPINPGTGWRYWDRNQNGVEDWGEQLELKFVIRSDDSARRDMGLFIADELEAVKVKVSRILVTASVARQIVMANKDFNLYTGGWVLGPDPDHLILWNSEYYWHPGIPLNYAGINNTEFDIYSNNVLYANTSEEAKINAWLAQEVFAFEVLSIPLFTYVGNKAMNRLYTGGNKWTVTTPDDGENAYRGKHWEGIVNSFGYGIDNYWSLLNMHPIGYERGDGKNMTIRWGFRAPIVSLNPIYAEWPWDWKVLGQIYEGLLKRNPFNLSELVPWLAESYTVGTWINPNTGSACSKIKFTLRPDATWSDGTPITVADTYFTLVELDDILAARGLPKPSWMNNVADVLSFKILDPYSFEILFDTPSIFALDWIAEQIILPKHIWKPIAETGDPTTFAPDPNMIGSGPWRFKEYVEGSHILMVANKPGSTIQTSHPGSTPVTSPKGFFRYHPVVTEAKVDGTNNAKIDYYMQPHTIDHTVYNQYLCGSIIMDINITYPDGNTYTEIGTVIAAEGTWSHSWTGELKGKKTTNIQISISAPSEFAGTYNWSHAYWSTIKEDIAGSNHIDPSLTAPDSKVDIKDVYKVAKAYGSYPGHPKWDPVCDIIGDYKIDIKDYYSVCKKYGWTG